MTEYDQDPCIKLTLGAASLSTRTDLLVVGVHEGERKVAGLADRKAARGLDAAVAAASFSGKADKTLVMAAPKGSGAALVVLVGLGKRTGDVREMARRLGGRALSKAADLASLRVTVVPPSPEPAIVEATSEGAFLADYAFTRRKGSGTGGSSKKPAVTITVAADEAARKALRGAMARVESVAAGVKLARDLGNEPANVLTPEALADAAVQLSKDRKDDGIRCKVLLPDAIRGLGMGAFLAVAQGSVLEPRFIHLTYRPKGKSSGRRVALVGKGLCFDSGGISIKPAASMEDMKFDMCGAAAVLGLFRCLPDLGVTHEVHGFIAATENMPSGSAVRPGDIVTSMAGRTIEVINTDAEGRLTLVDAITYALQFEPEIVVDLATLTGACAVALGAASGVMANNAKLREDLCRSSDESGERSWPLPLFDDYRSQLKSEHADIKNLGDRYGGALTAGLFIKEWVPDSVAWAHMDIAGSAWGDRELAYCPKGATGVGVRTLAHWLRNLS